MSPAQAQRLTFLLLCGCSLAGPAPAQEDILLPEVKVKARKPDGRTDAQRIAPTTTVNRERMDRWQASTVFEAAEGVPGVSLNGGPRSAGTLFNIRGYSDPEDVMVKLDGAQKSFEKYRFGGTFLEPELLKSFEVTRGSDVLQGSGNLGGTVSATTRDAADFLKPGQRAGLRLKYGTGSVNDEIARTGIGFARPTQRLDLLVAATRRNSGDYRTGEGTVLEDSAIDQRSLLAKGTYFVTDALSATLSALTLADATLQPFDATAGQPGLFGTVRREVDDRTNTATLRFNPGSRWVDLTFVAGHARTQVADECRPGRCVFSNPITGVVRDTFDFDVTTLDTRNTARFATGMVAHTLTLGVQYVRNRREVSRVTENQSLNDTRYPGGFNPAQPPGTRTTLGVALVDDLTWGNFSLVPGLRWDLNQVEAAGGTKARLDQFGQSSLVTVRETTRSLTAGYRPGGGAWLLGYRYVEGFRPPSIDEYFIQGAFGRCIPFFLGSAAPPSGICGDLYVPERASTHELSVGLSSWQPLPGVSAEARLVWFRNYRRNLLFSLRATSPGVVEQPGWEDRGGVEAEAGFTGRHFFGNAAWTRIEGEVFDGVRITDLFNVPGETVSITLGARAAQNRLDVGFRVRDVSARTVVIGLAPGSVPILGTQDGFRLLDLFLGYRPYQQVEFRVALDNALNEAYFLNNGFGGGIGAPAPGRNLRLSVAAQF